MVKTWKRWNGVAAHLIWDQLWLLKEKWNGSQEEATWLCCGKDRKGYHCGEESTTFKCSPFLSIFQPNRNGRLRGLAFALLRNTGIILPCFSKAWPLRPYDSSCQLSPPKELALWKLLIRDLIAYLQHVLLLLSQRNILTGNTSREMDENTGLLLHGDHVEQLFPTGVGFAITLFLTNPLLGRKSCSQTGQRVPNLPLTHVPSWSSWTQTLHCSRGL